MVSKIDESDSKPVPGTLLVRCVERIVQDGKYTLNFYNSSPLDESQTEPFYALEYIYELTNNNNNNICLKSNIQTSSVDYAPRELTHACSPKSNCATVTDTLNSVQVGEWYGVASN